MTGRVGFIRIYVGVHNTAAALTAGIYSNRAGRPGQRLSFGTLRHVRPGSWNTVRIPGVVVKSGRIYWLAALGRHGALVLRDRVDRSCTSYTSAWAIPYSLPVSWRNAKRGQVCEAAAQAEGSLVPGLGPIAGTGTAGLGAGTLTTTGRPTATAGVNLPTTLPLGVSLQQIDGGASYFCSSHFNGVSSVTWTQACSAGWDSPSFFPITNSDDDANRQSSIDGYHALGVNTILDPNYNSISGPGNATVLQWAHNDGMFVIGNADAATTAGLYPNISFGTAPQDTAVGYEWCDECDNTPGRFTDQPASSVLGESWTPGANCAKAWLAPDLQRVMDDMEGAKGAGDSTRFMMTNNDSSWVTNNLCFSAAPYVKASSILEYDDYVITHSYSAVNHPWRQYTDMMQARAWESQEGVSVPAWFYVEAATPFGGTDYSNVPATPADIAAETWQGIIGGARGVSYFDHNFCNAAGGCGYGSMSGLSDLLGSSSGGTYTLAQLQSQVSETDGVIRLLAPIINSQFVNNYISSTVTGTGNAMDTMVKWEPTSSADARCAGHSTGCFYVFSAPAFNSAQTATYTFKKSSSCPATVNAYRLLNDATVSSPTSISVTASGAGCQFSDTIANHGYVDSQAQNDAVLYVIPND